MSNFGEKTKILMTRESVNVFISVLSIFSILLISLDLFADFDQETRDVLEMGDFLICNILVLDWLWRFIYNKKDRYTLLNFIDLLASLPAIEVARYGRAFKSSKTS